MTMLTPAQKRVVSLIADGLMDKQIADRLQMTPSGVANCVSRLYAKLGFHNRVQLAVWYVRLTEGRTRNRSLAAPSEYVDESKVATGPGAPAF